MLAPVSVGAMANSATVSEGSLPFGRLGHGHSHSHEKGRERPEMHMDAHYKPGQEAGGRDVEPPLKQPRYGSNSFIRPGVL